MIIIITKIEITIQKIKITTREVIKKKNTMTIRDVIEENIPNKLRMDHTIIPTPIIQGLNFSEIDKVKYYDDLKRKNVNNSKKC